MSIQEEYYGSMSSVFVSLGWLAAEAKGYSAGQEGWMMATSAN